MNPDPEADIVALLQAAETTHADYKESLGGYDPEWPAWHAKYLLEHGLRDQLPRTVSGDPDALAERLLDLHTAFQRDDPSGDWVRFYAERLVAGEEKALTAGNVRGG
jgi:hypothetical protein